MSRHDELRARDARLADKIGLDHRAPVESTTPAGGKKKHLLLILLLLAMMIIGLAAVVLLISRGGNPDNQLLKVAREKAAAIGLVVAVLPDGSGITATAWAVQNDIYATNAHVVAAVAKIIQDGGQAQVHVNGQPNLRFDVVDAKIHPRYGDSMLGYDVGFLKIEGRAPRVFPLAAAAELHQLASGYRIAYLGFPSENLLGNNVRVDDPIATMQSGIITAVSDFSLGDSGFQKNQLIRHNLAAVGGASGSPIFNTRGEVVAILNAGNVKTCIAMQSDDNVQVEQTASAALINFAQRIDLLREILQ